MICAFLYANIRYALACSIQIYILQKKHIPGREGGERDYEKGLTVVMVLLLITSSLSIYSFAEVEDCEHIAGEVQIENQVPEDLEEDDVKGVAGGFLICLPDGDYDSCGLIQAIADHF